MEELPSTVDLLRNNWGAVSLMVFAIVGALREWWVPGKTHERIVAGLEAERDGFKAERNEWKQIALSRGRLAEEALGTSRDAVALADEEVYE